MYVSRLAITWWHMRSDRVKEQPEAAASLPASNSSKVESCSTSEYMVMPLKLDFSRPLITALAMVPTPACSGSRLSVRLPRSTSCSKKAIRWLAMAWVSSSDGRTAE
ncbi:hypothetical protein D3C72_2251350 [compost metagenome]